MRLTCFYFFIFIFFPGSLIKAQHRLNPVAKFSFNNEKDYDEISNKKIKIVGVKFVQDRFGNDNNAIHMDGSEGSYINLGTYAALKPVAGSISLWVKIEHPIFSGKGHMMNPIIITKRSEDEDFYESYVICYDPETEELATWCSKDSTKQVGITSVKIFERSKWHHVIITYNDANFCVYIDGVQERKIQKNFRTKFLATDSVMIGNTANKKNKRFLNATVDDIAFYNFVLSEDEVLELYNTPNPNRLTIFIHNTLKIAGVILVLVLFYFLVRYQVTLRIKKEKDQLELTNKLLETELRVNRALMNPHFVFNSLNALQHFILKREIPEANNYLIKFSKLIRKLLESNMANFISLDMEIELIEGYFEIESMRFEESIRHSIEISKDIIPSTVFIPVMMIQPFIENAIWHGLLKKTGEKTLIITFSSIGKKYLLCVIDDNGIGRQMTAHADPEKKSLATAFIMQRLELLNKLHNLSCTLTFDDKPHGQGTTVRILLPILNK